MDKDTLPNYKLIAEGIAELLVQKQTSYGNAFETTQHILKVLYPKGIPIEAYSHILTITRILDKIMRICTNNSPDSEPVKDAWVDIAGYAFLELGKIFKNEELGK